MWVIQHGRCFVFTWQSPPVIIHIKAILAPCLIHFVICVTGTTALGSLFGGARPLLIGLMADKWLFEKRYGLLRGEKKNRNWILGPISSLICHLFNIDVHYVYGLFGCLLFSGPARPVRLATWGSDNAICIDWFHSLIVSWLFFLMELLTQLKDNVCKWVRVQTTCYTGSVTQILRDRTIDSVSSSQAIISYLAHVYCFLYHLSWITCLFTGRKLTKI